MAPLAYLERPAAAAPEGLLVLHHGRGTEERDLLGLADALDPERRLRVVTPRAPLSLPGSPGYHWYLVPRVGYPDHDTFHAARAALAELHDRLWEETGVGPERTVLGGFSMGSVMSYAMALGADRPAVAGILAFSGFVPTVEGWEPSLADRQGDACLHRPRPPRPDHGGRVRASAPASCSRRAGSTVTYRESDLGHQIDPAHLADATGWLGETLAGAERYSDCCQARPAGGGPPDGRAGGRSSGWQ